MAAGFQVTKDGLNQRLGSVVVAGQSWLEDVQRLAAWVSQHSDELAGLGYTADEIAQIATIADLDNLRKVAIGQQAQAAPSNFFFNVEAFRGLV